MKKLLSVLVLLLAVHVGFAQCCNKKATKCSETTTVTKEKLENAAVKVYYFHATRRCATCKAVEKVTRETVNEQKAANKVVFLSVNRDTDKENPLLAKYKVDGQTLIVVKGTKVVDLTTSAFMNARTRPLKLKEKIQSVLDEMI